MSSVASSGTAEALKYRAVQSCSGIFGHAPPVNQVGGRPCCCYKGLRSFSPWTSGECATEGAITKSLVACRGERRAGGRARDDDGRRRRRRVGLRLLWVMDAFSRRVTARACVRVRRRRQWIEPLNHKCVRSKRPVSRAPINDAPSNSLKRCEGWRQRRQRL